MKTAALCLTMSLAVAACGDDPARTTGPDDDAPMVSSTSPSGGATGVALDAGIEIDFSEAVDVSGA
jgi:hypothetical protein